MVQHTDLLFSSLRRFTVLVAVSDTIWGLLAMMIVIIDLLRGNTGQKSTDWLIAIMFLIFVFIFVIGFGIALAWDAMEKIPRLLKAWLIPNIIFMCIVLATVFVRVFLVDKMNHELFTIVGFLLVRAIGVLKVYELSLHVQAEKKREHEGSSGRGQLCDENEMDT